MSYQPTRNDNGFYRRTLLQSEKTTKYEPRSLFRTQVVKNPTVSRTEYAVGRGHVVNYNTNGTGRDTYIHNNQGGFTTMNVPIKWPGVGSISQKPNLHAIRAKPNPVIHSKSVFYRANGTGRDSYIENTSGGQFTTISSTLDYREVFKKSLRTYERSTSRHKTPRPAFSAAVGGRRNDRERLNPKFLKQNGSVNNLNNQTIARDESPEMKQNQRNSNYDILVSSQNTFSAGFMRQQCQVKDYQNNLDRRLSQPKHLRKSMVGDFNQKNKSFKQFTTRQHTQGLTIKQALKSGGVTLKPKKGTNHYRTIDPTQA